jgi:FixJ family two-component response regulator
VIVVSGYSDETQENRIMQEGAMAFVQKPYRAYELSKALARVVGGGIGVDSSLRPAHDE